MEKSPAVIMLSLPFLVERLVFDSPPLLSSRLRDKSLLTQPNIKQNIYIRLPELGILSDLNPVVNNLLWKYVLRIVSLFGANLSWILLPGSASVALLVENSPPVAKTHSERPRI